MLLADRCDNTIACMPWGGERWYHIDIPPTEVPKNFMVGLNFNADHLAEKGTGILMSADPTVSESHSSIGTPESGYKPLEEKADWIMRVLVAPRARAKQVAPHAAPE